MGEGILPPRVQPSILAPSCPRGQDAPPRPALGPAALGVAKETEQNTGVSCRTGNRRGHTVSCGVHLPCAGPTYPQARVTLTAGPKAAVQSPDRPEGLGLVSAGWTLEPGWPGSGPGPSWAERVGHGGQSPKVYWWASLPSAPEGRDSLPPSPQNPVQVPFNSQWSVSRC